MPKADKGKGLFRLNGEPAMLGPSIIVGAGLAVSIQLNLDNETSGLTCRQMLARYSQREYLRSNGIEGLVQSIRISGGKIPARIARTILHDAFAIIANRCAEGD